MRWIDTANAQKYERDVRKCLYIGGFASGYLLFNRLKNSSLVFALDRMQPSIQLVVVIAPVF